MTPGNVIADRFEIESVAGHGGTAAVYRARDRETGDSVALKIGHPGTLAETERFIVEARLLSELGHPGIVRCVAHGVMPSGQWYLVLEWLEGEDLSQRLKRQGLSVSEAVNVALRAAEALGHAHQRGVIHRDVKPSNLFLVGRRPDDVRLLDFGVARRDAMQAITRTGLMLGTLGYMSAEQVRGERAIDARADVFALGCVLFKCIAGTNAFAGESAFRHDGASRCQRDGRCSLLDLPVQATAENRAVRIDDVTAGLLDARFVLGGDARGATLRGEQVQSDGSRTLLGRPTPCVGRERELANLRAMYEECVAESVAQVVLITAPAGGGKSRLRHELGRRLESDEAGAMAVVDELGTLEEGDVAVRLVHAEALWKSGDQGAARGAIQAARQRVLDRAERIRREDWRDAFLARSEQARTLELAQIWLE